MEVNIRGLHLLSCILSTTRYLHELLSSPSPLLKILLFLLFLTILVQLFCGYIGYAYQDRWQWTSFIFIFSLSFYFYFSLIFYFLFLEQFGLGFICHTVTSVTSWWQSHKTDHGTWENGVEGSGMKWHHTTWTTHVGLMSYTWSFRVGCTVVSTDHE